MVLSQTDSVIVVWQRLELSVDNILCIPIAVNKLRIQRRLQR